MSKKHKVALVAAVAQNNVIGSGGKLPWKLREDLKHFRNLTMGGAVIMGRKTFESLGRPLQGRTNIVVSRKADEGKEVQFNADTVIRYARSVEKAIALAQALHFEDDYVFVIGGGEIYEKALPLADTLFITRVLANVKGDTLFPVIGADWTVVDEWCYPADLDNEYEMRFLRLEKV